MLNLTNKDLISLFSSRTIANVKFFGCADQNYDDGVGELFDTPLKALRYGLFNQEMEYSESDNSILLPKSFYNDLFDKGFEVSLVAFSDNEIKLDDDTTNLDGKLK